MLATAPEDLVMTAAGLIPYNDQITSPEEIALQELLKEQDAIDDLAETLANNTDFRNAVNRYLWEGLITY